MLIMSYTETNRSIDAVVRNNLHLSAVAPTGFRERLWIAQDLAWLPVRQRNCPKRFIESPRRENLEVPTPGKKIATNAEGLCGLPIAATVHG